MRLVNYRDNLLTRRKDLKAIQFDEVSVAQGFSRIQAGGCETYGPVQQYTMNGIVPVARVQDQIIMEEDSVC